MESYDSERLGFGKMGYGYFFVFFFFFFYDLIFCFSESFSSNCFFVNIAHFMVFIFILLLLMVVVLFSRCKHYRRRCKIRAPCCNEIYSCRHCHNEATVFFCHFISFLFLHLERFAFVPLRS